MTDYCYYCGTTATSKEHVPPKCLFPEEKDIDNGMNYRKNLITVPSCDKHNSDKCNDDEYLQLIIVHGYFNNTVGRKHFNSKIVRALTRRPAMLAALYANQHPVTIDAQPTVAVDIDRERFNNVLEQVCQGLYFHEFRDSWKEEIKTYTPLLLLMNDPHSDEVNELVTNLSKVIIRELIDSEKKGDNPEIFWYQIKVNDTKRQLMIRMMFYEGFEIFAISDPMLRTTSSNNYNSADSKSTAAD
jgi:hypothetical protein